MPVLEYCSAVLCSAADTNHNQLMRVVSGACFRTGGVFEFNIAHRRSVAILCMLYKIRSQYVPGCYLVCQCGLHAVQTYSYSIIIRFLAADPRSTTGPLFQSPCRCGTILLTLYSMGWDWRVSRAGPMFFFYWPYIFHPFYYSTICPFLYFLSIG